MNIFIFDKKLIQFIEVKNPSRVLLLKFDSALERDLWQREIEKRLGKITDEITNNLYSSFTSQKTNCGAKLFVD